MLRRAAGFTLIELLIAMAIIGILAAAIIGTMSSARQRGRDAQRITDLKRIQVALNLYYDANDRYPAAIGPAASSVLVSGGYMETLPVDPSSGAMYSYAAYVTSAGNAALCSSYHLGADLESSTHAGLAADADATTLTASAGETVISPAVTACTGSSADFHGTDSGKCNSSSTGVACYDVRP